MPCCSLPFTITGARRKPFFAVRGPTTRLNENTAPGASTMPCMAFAAVSMLAPRLRELVMKDVVKAPSTVSTCATFSVGMRGISLT